MGSLDDLTGERFGNLTVVKRVANYVSPSGYRQSRYLCRYDDGTEKIMRRGAILKASNPTGENSKRARNKGLDDLTGLKVGRWSVMGRTYNDWWVCKCDCGKERNVRGSQLRTGKSKSCGCLQREIASRCAKEQQPWESYGYYSGTSISRICHTGARSGSTTGVRGVAFNTQLHKYIASIALRGEYIYLGCYADLLDAKVARKIAERILYIPIINEYNDQHSCAYALEDDGFCDEFASRFPGKFEDLKAKVEKLIFERKTKNDR